MSRLEGGKGAAPGGLKLVAGAVMVGIALFFALVWNRPQAASDAPASIVMNSLLLDADLPGTAPFPGGVNRDAALSGVLNAARGFNTACTTDQELYMVTDELTAIDAVNTAIRTQNYTRTTLLTTEQGVMFSLAGPKDLFVTEAGSALFICKI